MKKQANCHTAVWIAVRVDRGFVTEAKVFASYEKALKKKERWLSSMNPDYDDAQVVKSSLPRQ